MPRLNSIAVRLAIAFVALAVIPGLITVWIIDRSVERETQRVALGEVGRAVESRNELLSERIRMLEEEAVSLTDHASVRALADRLAHGAPDDETLRHAAADLTAYQDAMWGRCHHVFIADRSGTVILNPDHIARAPTDFGPPEFRPGPHTGQSIAEADGFEDAFTSVRVTGFFGFAERDHYHQLILAPCRSSDGETTAVLAIEVSIDAILRSLTDSLSIGHSGVVLLSTDDGLQVRHERSGKGWERTPEVIRMVMARGGEAWGVYRDESGRRVLAAAHASNVYPWIIAIEVGYDDVMSPQHAMRRGMGMGIGVGLVSFLIIAGWGGRLLGGPVRRLSASAARIAAGDLAHRIVVDRADELGALQSSVEAMRGAMQDQIDQLDATVLSRTAELQHANDRLSNLVATDRLTGLPSRDSMTEKLELAFRGFKDGTDEAFALLFLNFDRFKLINESLGHDAGDALLTSIAGRLRQSIRQHDFAARFGGDEFVVILTGIENGQKAVTRARALVKRLSKPHIVRGHEIVSTCSIGVAMSDTAYETPMDLIRDADAALHHAKSNGRAHVALFDRAMHEAAQQKFRIEEELHNAVARNELVLEYQPIVDIATMRVAGFESLVRWDHPEMGRVRPDQFIPVAEDTGWIVDIGAWVLVEACRQVSRWQRLPGIDPELYVTVNVAKGQLAHPGFVEFVRETILGSGVDPWRIKIEITESTVVDPQSGMGDVIDRLREMGLKIAIDDFGTGHSSLSLLHEFKFDLLKIDRSFISMMERSREIAAVLHAVITLAQNTGMKVVAEGVETDSQVGLLIAHGCDLVQGYYFSRPVPPEAAQRFVEHPDVSRTPDDTERRAA